MLALLIVFSCIPLSVDAANTYTINGVKVKYTDVSSSPNECWVYANAMYKKIWGSNFSSYRGTSDDMLRNLSASQLTMTKEHLKSYISAAALGSSLRYCNSEYLNSDDGWGHSQILVAKSSTGFTVFHGGLSAYDYRAEQTYTWDSFMSSYFGTTYKYIKYIKWPGAPAYNGSSTPGTDDLTLSDATYPTKLNVGQAFIIKGYIYSGITNITKATVAVYDTAGNFKTGKENITVNSTYYNVGNVDPFILFDKLAAGIYYYRITATNSAGTKTLMNRQFQVGDTVYYTVTFKDWNGTVLKTQSVQQGGSATAPASPSRTGYTFSGWDRSFTGVNSNITVTAKYTVNKYTNKIKLQAFGFRYGEGDNLAKNAKYIGDTYFTKSYGETYTVTAGMTTSTVPKGFKMGTSFESPDIGSSVSGFYNFGTTVTQPAKSLNLYYSCYPVIYYITYNMNGGLNSLENPAQYDILYGVTLKDPTREGYRFTGWTDENGKKINGINAGGNANHTSLDELFNKLNGRTIGDRTVTANWEKITRKGDINDDGTVDVTDLILMKMHLLNIATVTGNGLYNGDIDGSGAINITDYVQLKQFILGVRVPGIGSIDFLI